MQTLPEGQAGARPQPRCSTVCLTPASQTHRPTQGGSPESACILSHSEGDVDKEPRVCTWPLTQASSVPGLHCASGSRAVGSGPDAQWRRCSGRGPAVCPVQRTCTPSQWLQEGWAGWPAPVLSCPPSGVGCMQSRARRSCRPGHGLCLGHQGWSPRASGFAPRGCSRAEAGSPGGKNHA
jgi:hypothetical protein